MNNRLSNFIIYVRLIPTRYRSSAEHTKPRSEPNCRVLPPGEFNDIICEQLGVHSESCMTILWL